MLPDPEFLRTLDSWLGPIGPFKKLDKHMKRKMRWIYQLTKKDLKQLFYILVLSEQELSNLGIADPKEMQEDASDILGRLGKRYPKEVTPLLMELVKEHHKILLVLDAITEMQKSKNHTILAYIYPLISHTDPIFRAFLCALGETPGKESRKLLAAIKNQNLALDEETDNELLMACDRKGLLDF